MQTFLTQNYPLLLVLLAIAAMVTIGVLMDAKERKENKAILRHTISVNLGILRAEHAELSVIAAAAEPSAKVRKAKSLLAAVGVMSDGADARVTSNSSGKLQQLLTDVFAAMGKSTNARHLLCARHPYVGD